MKVNASIKRIEEQERKRKEEQEKKKKEEQERKKRKEENRKKQEIREKELLEKEEEEKKKRARQKEENKNLKEKNQDINQEDEKVKIREEKLKNFLKNIEENKRKAEEEKKKKVKEEEEIRRKEQSEKRIKFQERIEEEKRKGEENKKKKVEEEEIRRKEQSEKRIKFQETIEEEKRKGEEDKKKKVEEEEIRRKEQSEKRIKFQETIEEEKRKVEEEKKKKVKEEEEIKRKEQSEKRIQFQEAIEEEKRIEKERKKKQLEEEEQRKKEEEKKRIEEINKKRKEEEEERKRIEEEKRIQLEEEEKRRKEEEKKRIEEINKKIEEEKRKREEEKKRLKEEHNKQLIELLKRQKKLRNEETYNNTNNNYSGNNNYNNNNINNNNIQSDKQGNQNDKLRQTLEDMCIMGNIVKNQILEEKELNQEKFISIKEATEQIQKPNPSQDDEAMLCLGVLAQNLEDNGILTVIEREKDKKEEKNQEESSTSLQFLVNGLINKSKYDFIFDFGEEKNNELLNNKNEQEIFNNKLKKKLALEYNISEDKIIITCPQKGSYKVQVIFLSEEFDLPNPEQFKKSCENQKEFEELCYLKEIQKKVIMDGVKLTKDMLDYRGNQTPDGYGQNQIRGKHQYLPPLGWKGFGLKVLDKYDNGNNDWIKMDGNPNEWAIAYHGIGRNRNDVEEITNKIYHGGFKPGRGQYYANFDDINHPPNKIGIGVYCSPDINYIDNNNLAGVSNTMINGKKYKMAFMLRVKPDRIRVCNAALKEWILDGTVNEMRPYRLLLKEV